MNNIQIDDAQKLDLIILMYNLIEFTDAYSKTPVWLIQVFKE